MEDLQQLPGFLTALLRSQQQSQEASCRARACGAMLRTDSLGGPVSQSRCWVQVRTLLLPIQLPAIEHPGEQQLMAQTLRALSDMQKAQMKFPAPGFSSICLLWLLWASGEETSEWRFIFSLSVTLTC